MWISSALQIYGKRETWMESYSLWRLKDESFIESWKIIHQRRRPTTRLTSYNVISWHDKIRQWHAWASVDVVNVTRNKASWGNIFLLYLLGYFLLQKIETFEDRGCALPPAPDFGSRLEPEPPPSLETQLLLLLLWRPQVVVVGGWGWGRSLALARAATSDYFKPRAPASAICKPNLG